MRTWLRALLLAPVAASLGGLLAAPRLSSGLARADAIADRAKQVHASAIVVDTHIDAPDALSTKWADMASQGATDHLDIPRAKAGGLTAPFFAIYVAASFADHGAAHRALELIDLTHRVVDGHPNDMVMAVSPADIRAAKAAGKIGVLMGIEGGHAIEDSLAVLRQMYRAGVRYMTLTHFNTNHWADSSGAFYEPDFDPKKSAVHNGLTEFGKTVVKEMNRIGMIVDVSHVSDATIRDVLATSRAPVMASHSSCRALSNIPRNLTDDQIKQIAAKGGVVMINISSAFLDQKVWDASLAVTAKLKPKYLQLKAQYAKDPDKLAKAINDLQRSQPKLPRADWTKIVEHLEHVINIAGEDAVGIGTDFDGIGDPPTGFEDASMYPKLTEELLRRGHSEAQVKKVLGENFLAFFARVEATKAQLASEPPATAVYVPGSK